MNFWARLFGSSKGGAASQPKTAPDHTVRFRIVPIPHGRWALQKSYFQLYQYVGVVMEWRVVGEYDSAEDARADFSHVFCTPVTPLEAEDAGN